MVIPPRYYLLRQSEQVKNKSTRELGEPARKPLAIVGVADGDGSGDAAGALAGHVRNAATFHILIPRAAAERYLHAEG